jgi:hypothetical protein
LTFPHICLLKDPDDASIRQTGKEYKLGYDKRVALFYLPLPETLQFIKGLDIGTTTAAYQIPCLLDIFPDRVDILPDRSCVLERAKQIRESIRGNLQT